MFEFQKASLRKGEERPETGSKYFQIIYLIKDFYSEYVILQLNKKRKVH